LRDSRGFVVSGPDLSVGGERAARLGTSTGWPYHLETSIPGSIRGRGTRGAAESAKAGGVGPSGEGALAVMLVHRLSGEEMSALPAEPQQLSCSVEELRSLFLFEKLSEDQLQWLVRARGTCSCTSRAPSTPRAPPATCFYVLLEGTVVLSRRVGADDIEVGRTSTRGVYTGAFMAYLGDSVPQVYKQTRYG